MTRFFRYDEKIPTATSVIYARNEVRQFGKDNSLDGRVLVYGSSLWEGHEGFEPQHDLFSDVDLIFDDSGLGYHSKQVRKMFEKHCELITKETNVHIERRYLNEIKRKNLRTNPFVVDTFENISDSLGLEGYDELSKSFRGYNSREESRLRKRTLLNQLVDKYASILELEKNEFNPNNEDYLKLISNISKVPEKYALSALSIDGRFPNPYTGKTALNDFLQNPPDIDKNLIPRFESINNELAKYTQLVERLGQGVSEQEYNAELKNIADSLVLWTSILFRQLDKHSIKEERLGAATWIEYEDFWRQQTERDMFF